MTKPPAQPSVYLLAQETVTTGAAEVGKVLAISLNRERLVQKAGQKSWSEERNGALRLWPRIEQSERLPHL